MKTILVLGLGFLLMSCSASGVDANTLSQLSSLSARLGSAPHTVTARIAYRPPSVEASNLSANLFEVAEIKAEISGTFWFSPASQLVKVLQTQKLEKTSEAVRWATGVQLTDRVSKAPLLTIELSLPVHSMRINGEQYAATPDILAWFRREMVPIAAALNRNQEDPVGL